MVTRRFQHATYPKQVVIFRDDQLVPDECVGVDGYPMKQPMRWNISDAESYIRSGVWRELPEETPLAPPGADIPQMEVDAW